MISDVCLKKTITEVQAAVKKHYKTAGIYILPEYLKNSHDSIAVTFTRIRNKVRATDDAPSDWNSGTHYNIWERTFAVNCYRKSSGHCHIEQYKNGDRSPVNALSKLDSDLTDPAVTKF